ncbi:MAG: hypothetical protein FWG82_02360 [Oscillospiraceae bacterium]|nr:hypothetical protein [Oscillospiraceae bacterium]
MDTMLRAVLKTDHIESEKTAQLEKDREMIFEEIRLEKDKLLQKALEKAQDKIAENESLIDAQTQSLICELQKKSQLALLALDEQCQHNREEWAGELCEKLLCGSSC